MKRFYILLSLVFILFYSCAKQEGEGGLASIEGVVMVQNVNQLLEKSGTPYPAQDERVYIYYGNSESVNDDEKTSPNGTFSFSYLVPGNYTIFAYSKDTVSYSSTKSVDLITIAQSITINSKKETVKADTILTYKHISYNDGSSLVSGVIQRIEHYSGTSNPRPEVYLATNEDVFLTFKNNTSNILKRIRTSHDGTFEFTDLIEGEYTVFALSEDKLKLQDTPVMLHFTIESKNQKVALDTIKINNF